MTKRALFRILLLTALLLFLPACADVQQMAEAPIVGTREPVPTPDPGIVSESIDQLTAGTPLATQSFLGVSIEDWISVGVSAVLVLLLYLLAVWLLDRLFVWLARILDQTTADRARDRLGPLARWFILIYLIGTIMFRVGILPPTVRTLLVDALFIGGLVLGTLFIWRLIDLGMATYRARLADAGRLAELDPALLLITRLGRILLIVLSVSFLLTHFGINVTAITAALGIGGLALSLAARDTVADAIAGVIILFDRPFRVGDRIEIEDLGTWGDVVDIGLRTTRIRTRDNRMVIVPNSIINGNQIVNYTYPDPRYRIETTVGIAYGTDIETVRQLIGDTVRGVEGVLPDRPVDVLYDDMGDSAMIFRVRWWIESYTDTRRMNDRVHTALQAALDSHDIVSPFPTQTVQVQFDSPPPPLPPPSEAAAPGDEPDETA